MQRTVHENTVIYVMSTDEETSFKAWLGELMLDAATWRWLPKQVRRRLEKRYG